jgi:hypothetical protein
MGSWRAATSDINETDFWWNTIDNRSRSIFTHEENRGNGERRIKKNSSWKWYITKRANIFLYVSVHYMIRGNKMSYDFEEGINKAVFIAILFLLVILGLIIHYDLKPAIESFFNMNKWLPKFQPC